MKAVKQILVSLIETASLKQSCFRFCAIGNKMICIAIIFPFLYYGCVSKKQQEENFDFKPPKIVAGQGYKVPPEKILPPIIISATGVKTVRAGKPEVTYLKPNVFPAKRTSIIPAGIPTIIIPGRDGFKRPDLVPAIDSPFRAGSPEIIVLKDFYVKDDNPESFNTLDTRHGLMANDLNALFKDSKGNLWIGSWDGGGLSKYDGRSLTNYSVAQGLASNDIYAIFEDKSGNMWIGTGGSGVNKFDGKSITRYSQEQGLSNNYVTRITQSRNGDIWFGTDSGLNRYDGHSFLHYTEAQGLPRHVYDLLEDRNGHLWISTVTRDWAGRLAMFDGQKFQDFTDVFGLEKENPIKMMQDRKGNLWFGVTGKALIKYDGHSFTKIVGDGLENSLITNLIEDKAGNLWISTFAGFYKFDGESFTRFTTEHGLGDIGVRTILEDDGGNIWLCTNTGLSKFSGKLFNHVQWFQGLSHAGITGVRADRSGNVWVATWGAGVSKYDGKSISRLTTSQGLSSNNDEQILQDKDGKIWITTDGGVNMYDGEFITRYGVENGLVNSFAFCLIQDRKGNMWFGTGAGVSKFDGRSFTNYTTAQGLSGNYIQCIFEDHKGNIWFGTRDHGATRFDERGFTHFTNTNGLNDVTVNSVYEDENGIIWLATNSGLNKFDGKHFTWYGKEQGLSTDMANNVFEDDNGNIWIGTVNGLNKLNPEEKRASETVTHKPSYFFKRYTADEGFLGIGTYWGSVTQDNRGNLWFGAKDRITNYHLGGDIPDTVAPTMELSGIKLFDESISWYDLENKKDSSLALRNGTIIKNFQFSELTSFYNQPKDLKLLHDNNYVTFQFIGITTNRPKEVKYKYFLEGFDEKWSALTSQPEATYNNLPPGKYTFRVKASNSEGYWSKELNYPFQILPPWWKTWWAYTLFVIAGVTAFYGVIRWWLQQKYRSQIEKSEKEKEIAEIRQKATEMEMQALRAQMNPHFIFNSLNSINRFILQNNRTQASEYLTKFSKLVRMILQNSQASLISLEAELEALGLYLEMEALRFNYHFDYKISVSKDLDVEILQVPPLILQPYVENAIWHGLMHKEEKGQLNIDVREEDDHLYFRITDNGIGRRKAAELASKSATKHKSMGLRITKDRIAMLEKMNASESPVKIIDLEHEDGSAAGTEVIIKMPAIYD